MATHQRAADPANHLTTKMAAQERDGTGGSARDTILASTGRFWSESQLSGAKSTNQHLLTELVRSGELKHVRRGLYWRGRKTALGMSPPPPETLVQELLGSTGIGPAGLSAAHRLRLSTQVPRKVEIAVPGRPPTSSGPIRFVSRAARTGRLRFALSPDEVALLETLEGWSKIIELPLSEAWARLKELLSGPSLSAARLARAAETEPAAVRVRLAALLTQSGHAHAAAAVPAADPRTTRRALPAELAAGRP